MHSPSPAPDEYRRRIEAITAQDILLANDTSGPLDLKTSLSLHFDRAFDFDDLFPRQLQDHELRKALNQAFASQAAASHLNAFFKRPPATPLATGECAYFFRTLVARALPDDLTGPSGAAAYQSCSLAQALWARHLCHKRRDAFLMATLLLHNDLPDEAPPPLAPVTTVELAHALDLNALSHHLLATPAGTNPAEHLFATLEADVYYQGLRYRPPTLREREAGHEPNQYGKVTLPGAALNAPVAHVLDALLHAQAFSQWAARLAQALQLPEAINSRDLAEQAMTDWLYPPHARRAGYVLDFELFNPQNQRLPYADIRLDLTNSVQASLGCRPAVAELAAELLLRHFAPELLLDDTPTAIPYRPDLNWAILRQGVMLLRDLQRPLSHEQAEQILSQPVEDSAGSSEALRDTLAQWGPLQGHIAYMPPWSAQQWRTVYDHYLIAWDVAQLQQRPDRIAEACRLLEAANIDPAGHNADGQLHLEAYLDLQTRYSAKGLPDVTQWFEEAFDRWLASARILHEGLMQRLLRHLPEDYLQALREGPWTCYAATWPRYRQPDPVPPYGDSPEEHWQQEVGTLGMLVLLQGEHDHTLLELFPQRLTWHERAIPPAAAHRLSDIVTLPYQAYNEAPPTWDVATFHSSLSTIIQAPAQHRLEALTNAYVQYVGLGNSAALHAVSKGATRHEAFLAEKRQTSNWGYLWKLIKHTVPGAACIDAQNGQDAVSCILDLAAGAGSATRAIRRAANPLARLSAANSQAAQAMRLGLVKSARRWSELSELPPAVYARTVGPRRWHSQPELPTHATWPDNFRLDQPPPPGLTPGQFMRDRLTPPDAPLAWQGHPRPLSIARSDGHVDTLINGAIYRHHPGELSNTLRRIDNQKLSSAPAPTLQNAPYRNEGDRHIALSFSPAANEAHTPLFGQQVSHAFQHVRIEPAPIRMHGGDSRFDAWTQAMVHEGKVVNYTGQSSKPLAPIKALEARVRLGIITPPVYHRRITADPLAEFWFGLPETFSAAQVQLIARVCPPVRLGGLARTVPDRRTLRAAIIAWQSRDWIIVEADVGVFYAAQWVISPWQARQLNALAAGTLRPGDLPTPPSSTRQTLSRVRDDKMIERYLQVSETYRIVATRPNLQRDIDNLTALLRDWLEHSRASHPPVPSVFKEVLDAAEARMLPEYAKSILTAPTAQDALTGVAKLNLAGLNREIIPAWRPLRQAALTEQDHVALVLNTLLPATGTDAPFMPMSVAELLSEAGALQLRRHLPGANLAFATATLEDGSRRVYFSLSGGWKNRKVGIPTPPAEPHTRVTYIDARARMEGKPPSPRFTELPTLRRPDHLNIVEHHRHLDSERLIATVLNDDLLATHASVRSIDVFTLFSTCRSCGGYVLPRLRLDYGKASFSVSWLVDYKE
ncbi:TPA: deaminase domain-containing protein [Pseudomonas sp. H2]|uniref:deaminase domain-containing protein n=1 Tax=Pseudomonas sp. H2 TaxID=658612 RepID=UPI0005132BEB|nr:deaminase domain-containing protein [Pseudomonas sp. H2]KGI91990.1 hypothetical protein MD26_17525 [Pseudomonas sp. H2]